MTGSAPARWTFHNTIRDEIEDVGWPLLSGAVWGSGALWGCLVVSGAVWGSLGLLSVGCLQAGRRINFVVFLRVVVGSAD